MKRALTLRQAKQALKWLADGKFTRSQIAERYGVDRKTIWNLEHGVTYSELTS